MYSKGEFRYNIFGIFGLQVIELVVYVRRMTCGRIPKLLKIPCENSAKLLGYQQIGKTQYNFTTLITGNKRNCNIHDLKPRFGIGTQTLDINLFPKIPVFISGTVGKKKPTTEFVSSSSIWDRRDLKLGSGALDLRLRSTHHILKTLKKFNNV